VGRSGYHLIIGAGIFYVGSPALTPSISRMPFATGDRTKFSRPFGVKPIGAKRQGILPQISKQRKSLIANTAENRKKAYVEGDFPTNHPVSVT